MNKKVALTGGGAMVEALRQINPDVMPVYPITPQTPIVEGFAKISAEGKVDTEIITVESEHSAMSACVGASSAGARTVTATSSQGLALMNEILYTASGGRLPILMLVSARALSSPLNIHCDHSDVMSVRDSGWIQIFSENPQEAYNNTIIGLKVAEKSGLPVMVIMDGFITSHSVENLEILPDEKVKDFIGEFNPEHSLLDVVNPKTFGAIALPDSYFEFKIQQEEAMNKVVEVFKKVSQDFYEMFENCSSSKQGGMTHYSNVVKKSDVFECYKVDDAEKVIVVAGSTAGTVKDLVDEKRENGKKVGLLKIKLFRPFPFEQLANVLKNVKKVAVLDRAFASGSKSPIYSDVVEANCNSPLRDKENRNCFVRSYVYGLGGRDVFKKDIERVFDEMNEVNNSNRVRFLGVDSTD